MTKIETIKQLTAGRAAPFLSLNDVAKALRIGKDRAKTLLADVDFILMGKSRRYLVDDVAAVVMELRRR